MSKDSKHHAAHGHTAAPAPKQEKALGFGTNVIVLIVVLILGAAIVATVAGFMAGQASSTTTTATDKVALMSSVEKYINSNLLTEAGVSAKIIDANDAGNGLYAMSFEIYQDGKKVSAGTVYANSEKLVVGQAFDLAKPLPKQPATTQPAATAQPPKSDKPVVDLYVMSFCPFGNKAEDTFKPVYDLLGSKITFNVHYIVSTSGNNVTSLHGPTEVVEDEREACVLKNYDMNAWMNVAHYVNGYCGSAQTPSCFADAAKQFGIDANKIDSCVTTDGVALMKENEAASTAAGANGSPTMTINGVQTTVVYQYGGSDAYKQAICDAFNTAPSECSVTLPTATTSQGGSCS